MVVSGTWTMAGPAMRLPGSSRSPQKTGVSAKSPSSAQYTFRVPARDAAGPAAPRSGAGRGGVEGVREDVDRLVDMEEVGRGRAERRPERADAAERHDERFGAELARVDAGMHRPRASVGEDGEVARVVALVHGDLPDE